MNSLSTSEQNKLIASIQKAVNYTKAGMTPNQAIEKVARDENYTPPFIDLMVQNFNKAKAVHIMKEASSAQRHKNFPLANSTDIVRNIYSTVEKTASQGITLPDNLSSVGMFKQLEKVATDLDSRAKSYNPELTAASYTRALERYADFFGNLHKVASTEVASHRIKLMDAIQRVADYCAPMTDKQLQKTARMAVNGYPGTGDKMMRLVAFKIRREIPEDCLTKTASGHIFPAKEPYISMQAAYEGAKAMASAETWYTHIQKEATAGTSKLQTFLMGVASNRVTDPMRNMLSTEQPMSKDVNDDLDADYYNKIKALDAKRSLYGLMLEDPKFRSYSHKQVTDAWNGLADSHPKLLMDNPSAASALMLQQLETGGRRDLHEIEQAHKVEKAMNADTP